MEVVFNGKSEKVEKEMHLSEFLLARGLNADTIVVEYNGKIRKKEEWIDITLKDKDCLEVLRFVGGG